jgi:hypothetical protein
VAQRKELDLYRDVANFREDKNSKQVRALELLRSGNIKFLLYGGALGGAKSHFLRWYLACRTIELFQKTGIRNIPVMLACEDYPALKDRQIVKISKEFPPWLGELYDKHKIYGSCFLLAEEYGGGALCFRNLDDPSKYMSSEWAAIGVDELTKNRYDVFTDLRMRLRYPGLSDIDCQFIGATNPGGIGHGWVKQLWVDKMFSEEWIHPVDYRTTFAFVPALAEDNPYLDAGYWAMLQTLPQHLQGPFRRGDWNVFLGQAFPELSKITHGYETSEIIIPENAPMAWSFDWGFGKPFSMGWYFIDADKRLYRCAEWYGWNGTADTGLRLEDSAIAEGMIEREKKWGFDKHQIDRIASPDCFNRKPNYKGGGQGPSTAEVFRNHGINVRPGDPDRKLKIRQLRERLRGHEDELPMMLIDNNRCPQFWRTMSDLPLDPIDIEDVDTKAEDHCYDEVALMCMTRPLALKKDPKKVIIPKGASQVAWEEHRRIIENMDQIQGSEW